MRTRAAEAFMVAAFLVLKNAGQKKEKKRRRRHDVKEEE
jgi:hypothetical protein